MESRTFLQRHRGASHVLAAGLPFLVCLVLGSARGTWADQAALLLVLIVVAAAATGTRSTGLTAAVASALAYDFFLTAPYLTLAIVDAHAVLTTVVLLLVGVGASELAQWGRRQQRRAGQQQGYLSGVLDTQTSLAHAPLSEAVRDEVAARIRTVLGVDAVRFSEQPDSGTARLGPDGCVDGQGRTVDLARDGLPTDDVVALPTGSAGAAFLISSATAVRRPSWEQCRVAMAIADQLGAALDRDALSVRTHADRSRSA